jgi:hypothetical protein
MSKSARSLGREAKGLEVADLHGLLQEQGLQIARGELGSKTYGPSTESAVRELQERHQLPVTGTVDKRTRELLGKLVGAMPLGTRRVTGRIVFEYGLPASGLTVRAYGRGFGGHDTLLAEGKTGPDGSYALVYRARGGPAHLEIRTVDAEKKEVSISETKLGAARHEKLDLVAPASVRPLEPEYSRLAAALKHAIGGIGNLARARESGERKDLSIVSRDTGWDARLLALASRAAKLGDEAKLPVDTLYALFRVGLPSDPLRLARVSPKLVEQALEKAIAAGLLEKDDRQIQPALSAFTTWARSARLNSRARGAVSTLGELIDASGLSGEEKRVWEGVCLSTPSHRLWQEAAVQLPESVAKLRFQGKLAALTLNNAPLMSAVREELEGGEAPAELPALVDAGYYKPERWRALLEKAATRERRTKALIPPAYISREKADPAGAYAQDLARKVRLAFPTRVIGDRFVTGELALGAHGKEVGAFLKKASKHGFELGRMSVAGFLRGEAGRALAEAASKEVVEGVKTVQRLYQITPSHEALRTLLDNNLRSARDVVAIDRNTFLLHHGDKFATEAEARLVYRRAEQVHAAAYGLLTTARTVEGAVPVYAISGDASALDRAKGGIVKHYPTMEELFGSVDFCGCDHCRSVLSPAAYLVDILQFLNRPDQVWRPFVEDWNRGHEKKFGADYDKPYSQLDKRRPDLKHLPLTCENTNTSLPYIDVVNEILEYRVAHGSLAGNSGHGTNGARSAELLAEPQNVLREAYTILADGSRTKYPLGLPFDLWLETVRSFFAYFGTPLWQVMEIFRATDELSGPPSASVPYYRSAVFIESLGLSRQEWEIFTRPDPLASWWELYGYEDAEQARTALTNAKILSRKLGLSYQELVQAIETCFINPQFEKLRALEKLGIGLPDIYRYMNAPGHSPMSTGERAAFEQRLDAIQGVDAKAWVRARYADGSFDGALVLADPGTSCDFEQTTLARANSGATDLDFVKLNLFVRLWRKLGWRMEEVDSALTALLPARATLGPALGTALLYLAHLSGLAGRVSVGEDARLKLLALWTNLPATGKSSLYARLFLTPTVLRDAPIFDSPTGEYLSFPTPVPLVDHRLAVEAALTMTARELELVLDDANVDLAMAPLTLEMVSLLYRYKLLARALGMPVADLVALKRLSGVDPFTPLSQEPLRLDLANPSPISADPPFSQTLRFVDIAATVAASGFGLDELEYLFVHAPAAAARFRPAPDAALALAGSLAADIARIRNDTPARADQEPLIRQSIVASLAARHDVNADLVGALVTDRTLLRELTVRGGPLADAFATAGDAGVTTYRFTPGGWTPGDIAPTAEAQGGVAVRFECYAQVPTSGPYQFFVQLDKAGAFAELTFDHLPGPLVSVSAVNDAQEASATVELKAGVLYGIRLVVRRLQGGGARLLVQGGSLPKGRLDQITLHPAEAVERVLHADVVLAKALRLVQGLGLDEREVRHLLHHPEDFEGLDLSTLPTRHTPGSGFRHFAWFLRLAEYAALKRDLGIAGNDLIDVFESARRTYAATEDEDKKREAHMAELHERVAKLTRREPATVKQTATQLGLGAVSSTAAGKLVIKAADFAHERGMRRLWDALRAVELLGAPAEAIGRWLGVVDPERAGRPEIAADLKNTVKKRFEGDAWLSVSRPIFDALRQRKRDALVAYILFKERLNTLEQLYEHLLLDPGMEPVVQTSRIQLAISSVQLFVQRCLLNLEARVPPAAILSARDWDWMKRYRAWEANRKIFLYPENWLEPEFRSGKTHLFTELEGALLQGEISNDSAEDAFFKYLQGLEAVARLQMVSMYIEELDDGGRILHVIGRTHATPHKYFYRRYANRAWTPWEPVGAEVQGDHVAAVKWHGRLHLFWLTFLEQAEHTASPDAKIKDLVEKTEAEMLKKRIEVRLSWNSYADGQWTTYSSGAEYIDKPFDGDFDPMMVAVWVSKEDPVDGREGALRINVGSPIDQAFRIATRNSPPAVVGPASQPPESYFWPPLWREWGWMKTTTVPLSIMYGEGESSPESSHPILGGTPNGPYRLLLSDNRLRLPRPDIAPLYSPFFYEDDACSFFVVPEVTTSIEEGDTSGWDGGHVDLGDIGPLDIPVDGGVPDPRLDPGDPWASHEVKDPRDWVTDPATLLRFEDRYIGPEGGLDTRVVAAGAGQGTWVRTAPGSEGGGELMLEVRERGHKPAFKKGSQVRVVGAGGLASSALSGFQQTSPVTYLAPKTSPRRSETSVSTARNAGSGFHSLSDAKAVAQHHVIERRTLSYDFTLHQHPYAGELMQRLLEGSVQGLQSADTEYTGATLPNGLPRPKLYEEFFDQYGPEPIVRERPVRELDFSSSGAYAAYNWELFFHVPLTVAIHLSKNGRYEDAQRWFHYVFDPTDDSDGPTPERFWKVRPFQTTDVALIEKLLVDVAAGAAPADLLASIDAWRRAPFQPHLVAGYRPSAYMFKTVMAYLDNLIAWGDSLFRQDTREAINEAEQLYVLAAGILGPRPLQVPNLRRIRAQTYASLQPRLDPLGNALVDFETSVPFELVPLPGDTADTGAMTGIRSLGTALYFGVPRNDRLLGYWDTVADRLFKIRNSLNLAGAFRQPPLFEPPIDPALLARAAAAGVDVAAIVSGKDQPLPLVRFSLLVQKAAEICQEVKSLGSSLLSTLEKEDGEALQLLRARHERVVLELAESVRYSQWQEAIKVREGVEKTMANAVMRYVHYERLLGKPRSEITVPAPEHLVDAGERAARALNIREPEVSLRDIQIDVMRAIEGLPGAFSMSTLEKGELGMIVASNVLQGAATALHSASAIARAVGDGQARATPMGIGAGLTVGGTMLSGVASFLGNAARTASDVLGLAATIVGRVSAYQRRQQEWELQSNLAAGEITQLYKQLRAAQIREAIAEREWRNHQRLIEHSREVEQFLTDERVGKTTNQAFYAWLKREVKELHSRAFELAYEIARKAERALQQELGNTGLTFLQLPYMSGSQGLLAGEKLLLDIKRMEMAYHDLHRREYELTKNVSLRELDPVALLTLRMTGSCTFNLPEEAYDMDCPGHYFRRIKSVAVSIPAVAGPYTGVSATLRLERSWIRRDASAGGQYPRSGDNDPRFADAAGGPHSVVTSGAQNDSGLFETNLRDERILPFEGTGAISQWRLELPEEVRQFDYGSIADVVLHVRYTAREEGGLRKGAVENLETLFRQGTAPGSVRLLSVRHEFPVEWAKFTGLKIDARTPTAPLTLTLREEHYPFWSQGRTHTTLQVELFARTEKGVVSVSDAAGNTVTLEGDPSLSGLRRGTLSSVSLPKPVGDFTLSFDDTSMHELWIAVTSSHQARGL